MSWNELADTYDLSFWTYDMTSAILRSSNDTAPTETVKILLCGGLAGCATWSTIFPLDVIKTRVQTQPGLERDRLLEGSIVDRAPKVEGGYQRLRLHGPGSLWIAQTIYRTEGLRGFFRGFGVCNCRAFIVNAVQWAVYEGSMRMLVT